MKSFPSNAQQSAAIDELYFTNEELIELDKVGLPEVLSVSALEVITENIHRSHHESMVVCVACDQIFKERRTTVFSIENLPVQFFTVLLNQLAKTAMLLS